MEAQVAIGRLLQRFARIDPAGMPARGRRARFRGFTSYPVRLSS
jgi:cytochrome P450